jgi:OOP family OmpA-OmpF porin
MKKQLTIATFAAVSALAAAPLAHAADSPWYAGLGIGRSSLKLDTGDFSTTNLGAVSDSKKQTDTGGSVFGGYRFDKNWAAEVGYVDLGKATYTGYFPASASVSMKVTGWKLAGVGTLPLANSFSLYGRLGAMFGQVERSPFSLAPLDSTVKKRKTNAVWAAGVQYDFNKAVALRGEYEDYGSFGNPIVGTDPTAPVGMSGRVRASMWSANLVFSF